jgi:large subunit ribosomal protein L25
MTNYIIKAENRELQGKKVKILREKDFIPAVLYGHDIKNQNLSVKKNDFLKVYAQAGESQLIDLQIAEAKPVKILIHDLQMNPIKNEINHIDFYQIREDEEIHANVKLEFVGEAPAVKELGGVLVKNFDELEIECLPKDLELISQIKVDLSGLKTFNDVVYVKDLQVPAQIKILSLPDEVVALVTEIAEEKTEVAKAIAEIEVVKKEKGGEDAKAGEEKTEAKSGEKTAANTKK